MSKDVVVNGHIYNGISTVALALATGGTALFRDTDEASGGTVDGIVEIAAGKFSVASATAEYTINPGMSVEPDLVAVIPKYWHDTMNGNGAISVKSRHANAASGRRDVAANTSHYIGGINENDLSGAVVVGMTTMAKFQPTWTDADGNTGTQEYLWVAVKFAE